MTFFPATLRGRLTLYVFLLVAAVTIGALVIVERLMTRELSRELARNAAEQVRYVEGVLRHYARGEDAFVMDELTGLEARTGSLIDLRGPAGPVFVSAGLSGQSVVKPGAMILGGTSFYVAMSRVDSLTLALAVPATSMQRLQLAIGWSMVAVVAGALMVAALAARLIATRVVVPLDAVAAAAERIQSSNLSRRLSPPSSSTREVLGLAQSFNQMLERLEGAVERLRRFSGDAAHELRTPLAAMKARVQSANVATDGRDVATPILPELLHEIDRLSELVERLLVMARLDAASVEQEPVDLSDLVVERVERARPAAEQREVNLSVEHLDPVSVKGDVVLLRQALDNLLDNAVKYTAARGHVRVALRDRTTGPTMTVTDDGGGIGPDALPHIFDPFYREDSSRTRNTGGAGLGLAIVARIVEAHGGRVTADSTPGRGTSFQVELRNS